MPTQTKAELMAENRRLARRVAALERAREKSAPDQANAKKLRKALLDAEQRQAAMAEILRVTASSPGDVQPVFDAIARSAQRLLGGRSGVVTRVNGENLELVAFTSTGAEGDGILKAIPSRPLSATYDIHCRVAGSGTPEFQADTEADPQATPEGKAMARARGFRSVISVPMVRDGVAVGTIGVTRAKAGDFSGRDLSLLKAFADQAVMAIENVRLFNETKESLEQQTAISEILHVISNSRSDDQPVLDAVAKRAARICSAEFVDIVLRDGDTMRVRSAVGDSIGRPTDTLPCDRTTVMGRSIVDAASLQVADLQDASNEADFPSGRRLALRHGHRTILTVPLVREGVARGTFVLRRKEVRLFEDKHIALLRAFADQAAIAIENVRLFNETKEALERQTATAEILKVIAASPSDVQPVFDVIAESSIRLLGGKSAVVTRVAGDMLELAAMTATGAEGDESVRSSWPRPLSSSSLNGSVVRTGKPAHWSDIENDPAAPPELKARARARGTRSNLIVPMLRNGQAIGTISVTRAEAGSFTPHQISLLQTFADQAVIAIENVRLFNETKEALERQTATAEILKVISASPTRVQPVFDAIVGCAIRLCESDSAGVFMVSGDQLVAAHTPLSPAIAEHLRANFPRPVDTTSFIGRSIVEKRIFHVADVQDPANPPRQTSAKAGLFGSQLNVPMMREGKAIGVIVATRRRTGAFSESQVELLKTFADQAVIAIENVRLFNETKEALERQTATAEILKVISSSPTDTQPVFEAIVQSAARLFHPFNPAIVMREGDLVQIRAGAGADIANFDEIKALYPLPFDPETIMSARAMSEARTLEVLDMEAVKLHQSMRNVSRVAGFRSQTLVPLVREGKGIGTLSLSHPEPGRRLTANQLALVRTFADQAVIAIENVRLFNETKEALERQTATAEILKVIASSPSDVQPVFDAISQSARRLLGGYSASVARVDGDYVDLAAVSSDSEEGNEVLRRGYPRPIRSESGTQARAILSGRPAAVLDTESDPLLSPAIRDMARARGFRAAIGVPMMLKGAAVGAITVTRKEPGSFSDHQVGLLQTFADQAVIAIENVRLFNETKEALDHQRASAEVLAVISSSVADAKPVFDKIADSASELFSGRHVGIVLLKEDGLIHLAAHRGPATEAFAKRFPRAPDPGGAASSVISGRRAVQYPDVFNDPKVPPGLRASCEITGAKSVMQCPLISKGAGIGLLYVAREYVGAFSDKEMALLKTFADQAVIAIENVRLFKELESRTDALSKSVGQLTALGEVGNAISSTLDLDTVLKTIVSRATQLTGLDGGAIYEFDEDKQEFRLQISENMADELVQGGREVPIRLGDGAIGRTGVTREPTQVPDTLDDSYHSERKEMLIRAGYRAVLAVPLLREDHLLGALLVIRKTPGHFAEETVALLQTFATQSAMAIQNARLFREIAEKGRQLEIASHHKSDFLASMSHELRTPLNAILGFNELILGEIYGAVPEDMKEPLTDIQTSGKHLLRLINNVLDLAKIEAGRMELALADYSVHDTVESVRSTLRPLAAEKGLDFIATVPEDIPLAHGDFGRITQCLMNLAGNSLKFTKAGKVEIAVQLKEGVLVYQVNDTGIGIPPDKIGSLFTEFKQTDATIASEYGGTGLGLSISKKFIEMHGGRVWVESELGKGSSFIFEVPLRASAEKGAES